MYTFSKRLKTFSFALMIVGLVGIAWGFLNAPSTVEEAKEIVAHQESHDTHEVATTDGGDHQATSEHHDASHDEHVFHQLQNRPWSALYVAIFYFMMLSLGVLAFYAIDRKSVV